MEFKHLQVIVSRSSSLVIVSAPPENIAAAALVIGLASPFITFTSQPKAAAMMVSNENSVQSLTERERKKQRESEKYRDRGRESE